MVDRAAEKVSATNCRSLAALGMTGAALGGRGLLGMTGNGETIVGTWAYVSG
jgi:hypothetical protein